MSLFDAVCRTLVLSLVVLTGCISAPVTPPEPEPQPVGALTVFIVRHAEKEATGDDPPLTAAGQQRAEALRDTLQPHPVAAAYTTNTLRTRSTLAPLATARGLEPRLYDASQQGALARRLREEHRGQTVLVVGHSNTVLPLIEALGAARPVATLTDADYDYLFEVTLQSDGMVTAQTHRYGASSAP
jgi:broad specificity phosphatase PhoE